MNKRTKFALGTGLVVSLVSSAAMAGNPFQAAKILACYDNPSSATHTQMSVNTEDKSCPKRSGGESKINKDADKHCAAKTCSGIKKEGSKMSSEEKSKQDDKQSTPNAAVSASEGVSLPTTEMPQPKDSAGKCGAGRCG